mmetsp:Transcript_47281/g.119909  ORF Transcript_47281/g.119909 Transcript_47281/m.119909 type:complete len:263 (-) Transcript_47281:130-918(-)
MGMDVLSTCKLIFRVLGAICSGLFLVQALVVFVHPDMEDFWEFCHWLGQGLLAFIVGGVGCYFEFRGSMTRVANHFKRFCLNRLGLFIFYFWMGCYIMSGKGVVAEGDGWKTVSHITGFVSWFVALGDLLIACTSPGGEEDQEELHKNPRNSRTPDADIVGASEDPPEVVYSGTHGMSMFPTGLPPPPDQSDSLSSGTGSASVKKKGTKKDKKTTGRGMASFEGDSFADPADVSPNFDEPVVVDQPPAHWNGGLGGKPFGCS